MHGNDLVSDEVGTAHQQGANRRVVENLPRRDLGWNVESPSLGSSDSLGRKLSSIPSGLGDLEPLETGSIDTITSARGTRGHVFHDGTCYLAMLLATGEMSRNTYLGVPNPTRPNVR